MEIKNCITLEDYVKMYNRNVDVKRITQKSDPSNSLPLVNIGSDKSIRFSVQSIGINTFVKQNERLVLGCWHSLGKQEYYKPL